MAYWIGRFSDVYTKVFHSTLSWAESTQFLVLTRISLRPIVQLSSHLGLGLFPEGLKSILLNIMFHALMGRFQLELFIFNTHFFYRRPTHKLCFLFCMPFVVNTTFSTGFFSFFCLLAWAVDNWSLNLWAGQRWKNR